MASTTVDGVGSGKKGCDGIGDDNWALE